MSLFISTTQQYHSVKQWLIIKIRVNCNVTDVSSYSTSTLTTHMQTHTFAGAPPTPIPVASSPALLPLLQPRWAVLSAQTQTPAWGPEDPRLCEVASLPRTPDPAGVALPAAHTAGTAPSSGYCHSPGGGEKKHRGTDRDVKSGLISAAG